MMSNSPVNEYGQVLLAEAADTERHGRLTAASVTALRDSGSLALRTPIEYGGPWSDASTVVRRLSELGRVCPSAAWTAGTCATSKTMVALRHDTPARKEFFADPEALACGSGLPTGRGVRETEGIRVTGQWDNVSGCESAEWANVALMVDGAYHLAAIPLVDLTIERNWHMAGMRGTGSQRLVADGLLVPAHRVTPSGPPQPQEQLFFGLCLLAPVVGAAQGALDVVRDMFRSDRRPFMTSYTRMGDSPGARHWLADASLLVDRAGRTALTIARDSARDDLTDLDRAHLRANMAGAAKDCRDAVELMLDLHGAAGFRETNSLQRYWRDIAVGSRHPAFSAYLTTESLGAALIP
ncbi:acyl-CoA dehydrogenase family protein [Streptomyces sp. CRN 30]|uniref:acyl-CoA dehydrogenase family protein n=1 Tax=Streptomyces sp. CRN 30 TaxID=3075613 RepID=UPI002A835C5E|nr:acyl-CoA dehydrogenase family protein [Streptomyces sp. CRN 30]